ncbi:hypothetical protein [Streptomyces sp. NPDC017991]|uniref:hypothetical protein n=1 Tax=Streptomyces sp. NPDC017991 TaxID=3365026 RepID=UPI0037A28473
MRKPPDAVMTGQKAGEPRGITSADPAHPLDIEAASHLTPAPQDTPLSPLSAHLPGHYRRARSGALSAAPRDPVLDRIRDIPRDHDRACRACRACRAQDKEYV